MNEELKDLLQQLQDVKRTNAEKEMTWGKLDDRIGREPDAITGNIVRCLQRYLQC